MSFGCEINVDTSEAAVQYRIQTWINIFADCKQSGMTVQQYCDANQLSRDSYYYWYKKIRAMTLKQAAPSIVPIGTTNPVMEQSSVPKNTIATGHMLVPSTLTLQMGDISLTVTEATPDSLLRRTIRILREVK